MTRSINLTRSRQVKLALSSYSSQITPTLLVKKRIILSLPVRITVYTLLALLISAGSQAQITLQSPLESKVIGKDISFLRDDRKALTIDSLILPTYQSGFIQGTKDVFTHPVTRGAFWFRITLSNESGQDLWLEVGTISARYIDLYAPDSNGNYGKPILTGTQRGDSSKLYPVNLFWLPLNKADETEARTYYLRIEEESPFEVPLTAGTLQSLHKGKTLMDYLTAGFIGAILIMLLYNIFLWLSTREKLYLVYVIYLFTSLIIPPAHNGYPYISKVISEGWLFDHVVFFMSIANVIIGLFAILYLELRKEIPWVYRLISINIISIGVLGILNLFYPYGHLINIFQLLILSLYMACLLSAWYLLIRKRRQAFYYSMGWTFMIVFTTIFILTLNGYFPYNSFTRHSIYFGIALEAWMFSLALGNRINVLKKQQAQAQLELLDKVTENERLVRSQNHLLEVEVNRRTMEIQQQSALLLSMNRRLEESNLRLQEQAQNLEEMVDSRNRFFSILAHDLKSPFNTIIGFTELVIKNIGTFPLEKLKDHMESILSSSRHAYSLLDNLLEWGRMQTGDFDFRPQLFNFRQLMIETLTIAEAQAQQKGIRIEHSVDTDFEVYGDRDMIGTVLRNLITNALKFTKPGGKVNIGVEKNDQHYTIKISDTGVGIPEDNLNKLFRTDSKFNTKGTFNERGTGLGLILCKEFINKNGGNIQVNSIKGLGSEFSFTIPSNQN